MPCCRQLNMQAERAGPDHSVGRGGLANASPVRDERIANVEQRDPQSGDAQGSVAYYLDYGELSKKYEKYL